MDKEQLGAWVEGAAESIHEAISNRSLGRAKRKVARGLLRRAFGWQEDPDATVADGVKLLRELEAVLYDTQTFSYALARRIQRLWPISIRAFEERSMDLAAWNADRFVEVRQDRQDAVLDALNSSHFASNKTVRERYNQRADDDLDFRIVERGEEE